MRDVRVSGIIKVYVYNLLNIDQVGEVTKGSFVCFIQLIYQIFLWLILLILILLTLQSIFMDKQKYYV